MGTDNSKQEAEALTAILWNQSVIKAIGYGRISKQEETNI